MASMNPRPQEHHLSTLALLLFLQWTALHAGSYHEIREPALLDLQSDIIRLKQLPKPKGNSNERDLRARVASLELELRDKNMAQAQCSIIGSVELILPKGIDAGQHHFYLRVVEKRTVSPGMPGLSKGGDANPASAIGMMRITPGRNHAFVFNLPEESYGVELLMMDQPFAPLARKKQCTHMETPQADTQLLTRTSRSVDYDPELETSQPWISRTPAEQFYNNVLPKPKGVFFSVKSTANMDKGRCNYIGHFVFQPDAANFKKLPLWKKLFKDEVGSFQLHYADRHDRIRQDFSLDPGHVLKKLLPEQENGITSLPKN